MAARSAIVNAMAAAAVGAARSLNRDFGEIENLLSSRKGTRSFVARAHGRVAEKLARELSRARRDHAMPEDAANADPAAPAWLFAPIDGLGNLAHGVPHLATAVAVREGGKVAAAVVYDPLRDELHWAERGVGAYVNRRRVRCSGVADPESAAVALAPPAGLSPARLVAAASPADLRLTGSPALDLAWVASGRFDGFAGGVSAAVLAAGGLLLREAGALTETLRPEGAAAPLTLAAEGRLLAVLARRMEGLAPRRFPAPAARERRATAESDVES